MNENLKIICNAEAYKCKENECGLIVYNELYEKNYFYIFIMILMSLLVPDPEFAFKLPIAIRIHTDNTDTVTISKKLEVFGTENFSYFIPRRHFSRWKKTSLIVMMGISSFIMLMDVLLWYRFFIPANTSDSAHNPLLAIFGVLLVALTIFFITRAIKQYSLKNDLPICDDFII